MSHITRKQYKKAFNVGKSTSTNIQKEALKQAWKNRDFEIEMYWKRATYFWTFITICFAGYFIILENNGDEGKFKEAEFLVTCLGLVFSFIWYLANIGSKKWQENWEHHIDMLENEITGPIYKTVLRQKSYSVSRLNIKISLFVSIIWLILCIKFLYKNWYETFCWCWKNYCEIDISLLSIFILTVFFLLWSLFDWKALRLNKKPMNFSYSRKKVNYQDYPDDFSKT